MNDEGSFDYVIGLPNSKSQEMQAN